MISKPPQLPHHAPAAIATETAAAATAAVKEVAAAAIAAESAAAAALNCWMKLMKPVRCYVIFQ